ncbi:Mismatch repair protein msh3 [Oleoguttula sp. CCFEE 5521]
MGVSKVASSQPPSSQAKKQQSISNFFSKPSAPPALRKETSTLLVRSQPEQADTSDEHFEEPSPRQNGGAPTSNGKKRSLEAAEENREPKRSRPNSVREDTASDVEDDDVVVHSRPANTLPATNGSVGRKPKVTARTSKYLFSSPGAATQQDEEHAEDDEETRLLKQRLHQKFRKKLGRPDSIAEIKRRNHFISEETQGVEEEAEEPEEDEPEAAPKSKGRKVVAAKKGRDKLTPLEKQVLAIKHKHPDTLLVVEVGYKFKFFGTDAQAAAKELSIVCIPGRYRFDDPPHPSEAHIDRFASASVPVHRLHVHVKRLVSAGHKVGVVRQLETAALKAAGDTRNKAFERGLTNLYTKGTYIEDQEALEAPVTAPDGGSPATGHLLCLTETYPRGWGTDEKVQIGLVAVQPATGDIIYDDFEDGWMRSELETRLLHIAPCEMLIVGEVSKATEKLVKYLSASKTNIFGDNARVERVEKPKTMAAQSYSHITQFYADKMMTGQPSSSQVESSQETGTLLDKVHKLSENATICLSAMITHLTEYGLQHVFDLTKYFQSFSARSHMLLNGNTLNSLEIYLNQTDHTERGSLFWTLDRTHTRFGQRLLRKWVGRPLLDRARLDERVAAVEELQEMGQQTVMVDRIKHLLSKTRGDLERSLIRIYYKKCGRPELLTVLQSLQMIAQEFAHITSPADTHFKSPLLAEAVASLPRIGDDVVQYLERISLIHAKENDKYGFFTEASETEDIKDHKVGIVAVEQDLEDFRKIAAEKCKQKIPEYVTSSGIDFLIELDNTNLKHVPASWAKISGTKKVSRYHAPEVVRLLRERDQHKEALANACDAAFSDLLGEIGARYQAFRDCVQSLATLDCLLSLADVASQPGYCKPTFTPGIGISITNGRHPMVEQLLLDAFVPNSVSLSSETRALLITGPNMGGKSSYVRFVALIAILAQIGSSVPAETCELGLLDAVFTRMGAFDNMMKGESTFMVELSETSDILKQATPRSLVILDELGRGTSTHDGVAIAQAVLSHIVSDLKPLTLFITHYQSLARLASQYPAGELRNVHMRFTEQDEDESGQRDITFLYEVGEGVAHRSYGLNVAKLAGLPKGLIDEAGLRSENMEVADGRRRLAFLGDAAAKLMGPEKPERALERFVGGLEML